MRRIERYPEPAFWKKYKKENPHITYERMRKTDEGLALARLLREYLIDSQYGLCAYCCRQIGLESSLNEHIRPQGIQKYAKLSMEYDNIVANCRGDLPEPTCSTRKKNAFNEKLFVSPLDTDCESHFAFAPNGEVYGTTEQGKYTIELLGLNAYRLKMARYAMIQSCDNYGDAELVRELFLIQADGKLGRFADAIQYLYDKGYFVKNKGDK